MKLFLTLFAATLAAGVLSAPIHRPRLRMRPSAPLQLIRKTPWQNIVAGGAAAGTVILACKVGNGVENGLQTVAKEKPQTFINSFSGIFTPIRYALWALLLYLGWRIYSYFKLNRRRKSHESIKK